jgi:hypothetical protein
LSNDTAKSHGCGSVGCGQLTVILGMHRVRRKHLVVQRARKATASPCAISLIPNLHLACHGSEQAAVWQSLCAQVSKVKSLIIYQSSNSRESYFFDFEI